jgi:hypothetical protein
MDADGRGVPLLVRFFIHVCVRFALYHCALSRGESGWDRRAGEMETGGEGCKEEGVRKIGYVVAGKDVGVRVCRGVREEWGGRGC